jgi:SnoaL-like domain
MSHDDVQRWLDAYVEAWRSYHRDGIGELFTEDATYAYHPYDAKPIRGRDAIIEDWLSDQDEPESWKASYEPLLIDGDRAVVVGETRYTNGDVYSNLWVMRFAADGRCADYVEWFMKHP